LLLAGASWLASVVPLPRRRRKLGALPLATHDRTRAPWLQRTRWWGWAAVVGLIAIS
jgi:hypothetical protein